MSTKLFLPSSWDMATQLGDTSQSSCGQMWPRDYYSVLDVSGRDEGYFQSLGLETGGASLPHPNSLKPESGGGSAEPHRLQPCPRGWWSKMKGTVSLSDFMKEW